jgi:hypothetical protein
MGSLFSYCADFTKKENNKIDVKYIDFIEQRPIDKYDVNIDFDEASKAWRNNKLNFACCNYVYICPFIKDNKKCGKRPYNGKEYCRIHGKFIKKI